MATVLIRMTTNLTEAWQVGTNLISAAYTDFSKTAVGSVVAPVFDTITGTIPESLDKRSLLIGGGSVSSISFIRKMNRTPHYYLDRALKLGPNDADYKKGINDAKKKL